MTEINKVVCYARVSTENQKLDSQIEKLENFCESRGYDYDLYSEKVSSVSDRPELEKIFNSLDEYDALIVTKLDRLARSMKDMIVRKERLSESDTEFITIDQHFDTSTKEGQLMLNTMIVYADFERKMIRERMEEGFRKAQERGEVGRPKKISGEAEKKFEEWWNQGYGPSVLKALLKNTFEIDVSADTIYRTADRLGLRGDSDE